MKKLLIFGAAVAASIVVAACGGGSSEDTAVPASGKTVCRAALINPAVHPHRHFERYLGPQKNLYTGEEFVLTPGHVEELPALDPPVLTRIERYWLFVETGDVVLDYREALERYTGALHEVVRGGDHSLV